MTASILSQNMYKPIARKNIKVVIPQIKFLIQISGPYQDTGKEKSNHYSKAPCTILIIS